MTEPRLLHLRPILLFALGWSDTGDPAVSAVLDHQIGVLRKRGRVGFAQRDVGRSAGGVDLLGRCHQLRDKLGTGLHLGGRRRRRTRFSGRVAANSAT